jgi:molybdenum cofactor biosynthesis enzyme MoaA
MPSCGRRAETNVLIRKTMRECYEKGARNLSISSSGEPTLSPEAVTDALTISLSLALREGMVYKPINLYTNGIRIGEDVNFCRNYLTKWRRMGLTTCYVTVHSTDAIENARIYGVKSYPDLPIVIHHLHEAGLAMRANVVLNKNAIGTVDRFIDTVNVLRMLVSSRQERRSGRTLGTR